MSTNLWEDFAQRSRELYQQQADLAKSWMEGQAKLAGTLAGTGQGEGQAGAWGAEAAAMADLWRSWLKLGSSFGSAMPGQTMPGMGEPGKIAGETLGRFLDPMSLALVGGSQVGETIRRLTEGPRFADLGAIERRMARLMELWLKVQQAARGLRGRGRRRLDGGQRALRARVPGSRPWPARRPPSPRTRSSCGSTSPTGRCSRPTARSGSWPHKPSSCATAWTSSWPSARWSRRWSSPPACRPAPSSTRSTARSRS